jgi:excinuclease ABC subunit C
LKRTGQTVSVLDAIPGVGPLTRKKMMRAFGSGRGVKLADLTALQSVLGVKTGSLVYNHLHDDSGILNKEDA